MLKVSANPLREKTCKQLLVKFVSFSFNTEDSKTTTDEVREYRRQLLGLGLLRMLLEKVMGDAY